LLPDVSAFVGEYARRPSSPVPTGGDSGILRAVAVPFAREDARVTERLLKEAGREVVLVPADLTQEDSCRALVDRAVEQFGRIDILVNNSAYQMAQPGGIADITTEQFDRVMKTNLYAMFWLCKMTLPHMQRGACIINTSSVQASSPSAEQLDYASTKAGIANFTRGLASMVADRASE
jgi:NAD(P)-dependent dehydrogenase (short-subunit alcohol dehydrogenase family)